MKFNELFTKLIDECPLAEVTNLTQYKEIRENRYPNIGNELIKDYTNPKERKKKIRKLHNTRVLKEFKAETKQKKA